MRRVLLKSLLAMTGDGLRRPLNAPPSGQDTPIGVQPGTTSPVVVASRVIIIGTQGLVLAYSPTAAAGNLVESMAAQGSTDQFGNQYLTGHTTYTNLGAGQWAALGQTGTTQTAYISSGGIEGNWVQLAKTQFSGTSSASATWGVQAGIIGLTASETVIAGVAGNVTYVSPSNDTTGVTDAATINNALATSSVRLLPGRYWVNTPIVAQSWTALEGVAQVSLNNGTPASRIIGVAGLSGEVISLPAVISAAVRNVVIDCTGIGGSTAGGITMTGACYDAHLDNVLIMGAPHNGVSASGFHHRFNRVTSTAAGNFGINVANCTDSTFTDCLCFGSTQDNWVLQNMSNCLFTACRAEWSTSGSGFHFSGSGWSGTCVLAGCSTDHNGGVGVTISSISPSASEQAGITIAGFKAHADQGADAVRIQGASVPVAITGLTIDVGTNPNTSVIYPANGISIGSIAGSGVIVGDSMLGAITTPWAWDGTGVVARSGCISATGNPGAQVFARLADI